MNHASEKLDSGNKSRHFTTVQKGVMNLFHAKHGHLKTSKAIGRRGRRDAIAEQNAGEGRTVTMLVTTILALLHI